MGSYSRLRGSCGKIIYQYIIIIPLHRDTRRKEGLLDQHTEVTGNQGFHLGLDSLSCICLMGLFDFVFTIFINVFLYNVFELLQQYGGLFSGRIWANSEINFYLITGFNRFCSAVSIYTVRKSKYSGHTSTSVNNLRTNANLLKTSVDMEQKKQADAELNAVQKNYDANATAYQV